MCRATDIVRKAIGINEYAPRTTYRARVRMPTWHGARGTNGHARRVEAFGLTVDPVIADLAREHRVIRQMVSDAERARERGQQ